MEYVARHGRGEYKALFRCLEDGCGNTIEIDLDCPKGYPLPPLGRLYWLRMDGDILQVKSVDG